MQMFRLPYLDRIYNAATNLGPLFESLDVNLAASGCLGQVQEN